MDPALGEIAGERVLDQVDEFLNRFIAYPDENARHAHVLWLAHTHRMDVWDSTPRIAFLSPEKGSGKTRALEVSMHLVSNPVFVSHCTVGFVLHQVSREPKPTLLLDEMDTVYGPRAKGNEALRAILNSGHRRVGRGGRGGWDSQDGLKSSQYPAYCAVALAGLGQLPDTIADRAVIIQMKKRKRTDRVDSWRDRLHAEEAQELGRQLGAWMEKAPLCLPKSMPVEDRAADVWEALIMIADAAGGSWPSRARKAALAFASEEPAESKGVQLLRDLQTVFGRDDRLSTEEIVRRLTDLEESPWLQFHYDGSPINARDPSRLLRPYGIRPKDIWMSGDRKPLKGYSADDLKDAWERYVPPSVIREKREDREAPPAK
ncbi:hypothetical protein A5776_23435 [Mycolicibacterium elephantis]|nr:hypothetical protein A5776_23435 [Mycolicibacterium elephantis]